MLQLSYKLPIFITLLITLIGPALQARPPSKRALERAFLEENANKPGIVTTKSGLQYLILKEGEGTEHPKYRNTIRIHFHGSLIDGTVFESTLNRAHPMTMRLENLIPGWTEGIKLMNVGDKYRFYIPSKLGYGSSKTGIIPAYSVLIFDIELFEIKKR